MIQTIKKAWAIPELRKKIVFTALILLIFRIGNAIPVPYVDTKLLGDYLSQMSTTVLGLYNVMSGGAFAEATVFALGVQPYINSSIIIQLLTIAIPALERLARDGGEAGKKKIASITRYATVAIALLQGFGYYMICKNYNILEQQGIWPALVIIVSFVAGSSFVMWLGEQVNEFGVGNGISIILFAGILSRVPNMVTMGASYIRTKGSIGCLWIALLIVGMLAMVVLIVHVNEAERRIPVQYAKRQVGRKMYGGQASTLPMKVNMSGVLPIIFAQSIAMIPSTIAHELSHQRGIASEQECNFIAIAASTTAQSPAYRYSGWLMGFTYLSNALYRADQEAWKQVRMLLPDTVVADLRDNSAYWAEFEGPVNDAAQKVYDSFLKSSGESRGTQSYGTVVDMLMAYYG